MVLICLLQGSSAEKEVFSLLLSLEELRLNESEAWKGGCEEGKGRESGYTSTSTRTPDTTLDSHIEMEEPQEQGRQTLPFLTLPYPRKESVEVVELQEEQESEEEEEDGRASPFLSNLRRETMEEVEMEQEEEEEHGRMSPFQTNLERVTVVEMDEEENNRVW